MVRLMQKERLKSPPKSLIIENQAFGVILAIFPQMGILVILASHFRTRVERRKKFHLGYCLHQRDRATFEFGGVYTHRKPGKKIDVRGGFNPPDTPGTRMEIRTLRSAIADLNPPPPGAPSGALGARGRHPWLGLAVRCGDLALSLKNMPFCTFFA